MSSGGPPSREVGGGGEERLISVAFNSARILLLSKMGCEIVSAKLLYGDVFLVGCFFKKETLTFVCLHH